MQRHEPSAMDVRHLAVIRANVSRFIATAAQRCGGKRRVLDIAPQVHEGAVAYFKDAQVLTLDIDPASGADYIADICADNSRLILGESFDAVVCTEVLEHTLNPFDAVREIRRILCRDGLLFLTTPFNFRIHGPLPDCWRFTEHGLRALLSGWEIVELDEAVTPDRPLMPIHYTVIARRI